MSSDIMFRLRCLRLDPCAACLLSVFRLLKLRLCDIQTARVSTEDDLEKSWKTRLLAHRVELLIASCTVVGVTLALGIGLGGEELGAV